MTALSWDMLDDHSPEIGTSSHPGIANPQQKKTLADYVAEGNALLDSVGHKDPATSAAIKRIKEMSLLQAVDGLRMGGERICAEDKRILGGHGDTDVNQLIPFKYEWAWQKYLDGCANHWMPQEINMTADIALWKSSKLTQQERHVVEQSLGFFSTADSIVLNNIAEGLERHIKAPECRQYLARQRFEEAIHTHAYQYCIQSLGINEGDIFNKYRETPSMALKSAWCIKHSSEICDPNFVVDLNNMSTVETLVRDMAAFYLAMEGLFFYCGFSQVLSMARRGRMTGVGEQFQYILRDESMHVNFGVDMINQIKAEVPDLWSKGFQSVICDMIAEARVIEKAYARDAMPEGGMVGMHPDAMDQYLDFTADRRLIQIGLAPQTTAGNPFTWMSEMMDLRKEKNFFETRVTDYQVSSGLQW